MGVTDITIREARPDDYEGVAAFTRETWADREGGDYIPEIYHEWITGDGDRRRTFLADSGDDVAGICQGVLLSDHEAWAQGMRVNPDYRGEGLSTQLNDALFGWARERGATVVRNMVFSWNAAGLGGSRAVGFAPLREFRWAHPEPAVIVPKPYMVAADADARSRSRNPKARSRNPEARLRRGYCPRSGGREPRLRARSRARLSAANRFRSFRRSLWLDQSNGYPTTSSLKLTP